MAKSIVRPAPRDIVNPYVALTGLLAASVAAAANLAVFGLAGNVFGVKFVIPMGGPGSPPAALGALQVAVASIVPAIAATLLLTGLKLVSQRPLLLFQRIALVLLVLSFAAPLTLPVAAATRLALATMHVGAGAAIVGVLSATARGGRLSAE